MSEMEHGYEADLVVVLVSSMISKEVISPKCLVLFGIISF